MAEYDLHSVAFPTLTEEQIGQIVSCTTVAPKLYRNGETLIAIGERGLKFFIVKSGEIEIVDHSGDQSKTIAIHHKGQLPGDSSHLTGMPSIVTAVRWAHAELLE